MTPNIDLCIKTNNKKQQQMTEIWNKVLMMPIINTIFTRWLACSLECIVNWPEPADEGAGNKEDKQKN